MKRCKNAFTLLEVMIVVLILAILATIVVPSIAAARGEARKSGAEAAAQEVGKAIGYYKAATGTLPDLVTDWSPLLTQTYTSDGTAVGPFLATAPVNPMLKANPSSVIDGNRSAYTDEAAFVYDYAKGQGTGRFAATMQR
jgi:prepilin-type N-terminal cleavage/methylation domain-containing protein